jgi:hypothetical protein
MTPVTQKSRTHVTTSWFRGLAIGSQIPAARDQ